MKENKNRKRVVAEGKGFGKGRGGSKNTFFFFKISKNCHNIKTHKFRRRKKIEKGVWPGGGGVQKLHFLFYF